MSIGNIKQRKLDPVTIKHAGDGIKDTADWMDRHAHVIMEEGVRAKFTQNYELVTAITVHTDRLKEFPRMLSVRHVLGYRSILI